ncbi:sugar phosphate isomerase/epimerase [Bacillaceae bacterium]
MWRKWVNRKKCGGLPVKLSCQEHLVPGERFGDKLAWLERHGFSAIEVWAFDIGERIGDIKGALRDSQVTVSTLCGGYEGHLHDPSPQVRRTAIQGVKRLIRYAAEIDCPGVIVTPSFGGSQCLGVLRPLPRVTEEDIAVFAESLAEVVEEAARYGVCIYVEPINRYECRLFHKIEEVAEVLAHLGRSGQPYLGVLADIYHMQMEEASILATIRRYAPVIAYVHVADSNRRMPGKGHLDFVSILKTFRESGYDGYFSFECFVETGDELLAGKRYLEMCWQGLHEMNGMEEFA